MVEDSRGGGGTLAPFARPPERLFVPPTLGRVFATSCSSQTVPSVADEPSSSFAVVWASEDLVIRTAGGRLACSFPLFPTPFAPRCPPVEPTSPPTLSFPTSPSTSSPPSSFPRPVSRTCTSSSLLKSSSKPFTPPPCFAVRAGGLDERREEEP